MPVYQIGKDYFGISNTSPKIDESVEREGRRTFEDAFSISSDKIQIVTPARPKVPTPRTSDK